MKKLVIVLLFPVLAFAQKSKSVDKVETFVISGSVTGLPDSTLVAYGRPGDASGVVATAYSKNGKFKLFGKVNDYDIYQLSFLGNPEVVTVFAGNEPINVAGDYSAIPKINVTGPVYHKDFLAYMTQFNGLKNQLNELVATANKTEQGPQRDALIKKIDVAKQQVMKQVDLFVKARPSSPVSTFLVYVTSPVSGSIAAVEQRYKKLKPAAKEGFYAAEIERMIASTRVGMVGTEAVDFTQNDTANIPVKLSAFKGKYVLVDFWASWCGPCRMENPAVVAAYNDYKDKGFTVLGVSLDMNKDKWLQAIKADNLTWTHVSDLKYWNNAVAQLYHIQSIPSNMLIDPTGKIVGRDLRGEALHSLLKQVLK